MSKSWNFFAEERHDIESLKNCVGSDQMACSVAI